MTGTAGEPDAGGFAEEAVGDGRTAQDLAAGGAVGRGGRRRARQLGGAAGLRHLGRAAAHRGGRGAPCSNRNNPCMPRAPVSFVLAGESGLLTGQPSAHPHLCTTNLFVPMQRHAPFLRRQWGAGRRAWGRLRAFRATASPPTRPTAGAPARARAVAAPTPRCPRRCARVSTSCHETKSLTDHIPLMLCSACLSCRTALALCTCSSSMLWHVPSRSCCVLWGCAPLLTLRYVCCSRQSGCLPAVPSTSVRASLVGGQPELRRHLIADLA